MCLRLITNHHDPAIKGPVIGYKLFKFYPKTNKLYGAYWSLNYRFHKIYKAVPSIYGLSDNNGYSYKCGFHFFPTRQAARDFKKLTGKNECRIFKIKAYDVHTEGIDENVYSKDIPTHIADKIMILEGIIR